MTSRRETAIAAVHARLLSMTGPRVTRNEALPDTIPAGGLVNLADGEPVEVDETLGIVTRHFAERLDIELIVRAADGPARAAALDALAAATAGALDINPAAGGDPTLGGAMDHARLMPPEAAADLAVPGDEGVKAAILPLEIDYVTGANPMEAV